MRKVTSLYVLIVVGLLCAFMGNANIAMSNNSNSQSQLATAQQGEAAASGSHASHYTKTKTITRYESETINGVTTEKRWSEVTTLTKDDEGNWVRTTDYVDANGKKIEGKESKVEKNPSDLSESEKKAYEEKDEKYQEQVANGKTAEEAQKEVANNTTEIPDNTVMTLAMKNSDEEIDQSKSLGEELPKDIPSLPANFRGGDPDSGLVHCIEDVYYEKHEHSLIYNADSAELASDSRYTSDPNITWDTKKKVKDEETGEEKFVDVESKNTNVASDGGKFYAPGDYNIGNSGARQVKSTVEEKEEDDAVGGDSSETTEDDKTDGEKTVTALQNMGVMVHDVTPPDLWLVFKESAGEEVTAEDMDQLKDALKARIKEREKDIITTKNSVNANEDSAKLMAIRADDYKSGEKGEAINFADKSFLVLEEGLPKERDMFPFRKKNGGGVKITRVTRAGSFFDESGAPAYDSSIIEDVLIDEENFYFASKLEENSERLDVNIKTEEEEVKYKDKSGEEKTEKVIRTIEDESTLPRKSLCAAGKETEEQKEDSKFRLYVRKNIPFVVAAVMTDNEDERRAATDVDQNNIQFTDNGEVMQPDSNGQYLFRTANWPATDEKKEHDYAFVAKVKDASGNVTEVRMPVCVVDSYSSFESTK